MENVTNDITPNALKNNCQKSLNFQDDCHYEFPDFLFGYQVRANEVKALVFTQEEQELYGLLKMYNKTLLAKRGHYENDDDNDFYVSFDGIDYVAYSHAIAPFLPYKYVKEKGSFKILSLYRKIIEKKIYFYDKVIFEYLVDNPNVIFNVNDLSTREIFDMFSTISKDDILQLKEVFSTSDTIICRKDDNIFLNPSKIKLGEWCMKDRYIKTHLEEGYKIIPSTKKHEISFKGTAYITLTDLGKKLINWYIEEFCPNEEKPFKN